MTAGSPTAEQTNAATAKLLEVIETVVDMALRYGDAEFTVGKIRSETWPLYAANSILRAAAEVEIVEAPHFFGPDGRGNATGANVGSPTVEPKR